MKQLLLFIKTNIAVLFMLLTISTFAQDGINYQGVARNAEGELIIDTEITLDFNINKITADGETVYSETHNISTDANGVFSLVIGQGTPSLNLIEDINWAENQHFLNVWLNGAEVGTTPFAAVPYTQAIGKWQAHNNGVTSKGMGGSIYIGDNAGVLDDLTDNHNIGIGENALNRNTEGDRNIAIGEKTLRFNSEGYGNIALGSQAMENNTTGFNNIAHGYQALHHNSSGLENIANGTYALYSNTNGRNNVALGENTLDVNTTGDNNIAIGKNSLTSNVEGGDNVAIGREALRYLTDDHFNIAIGTRALNDKIDGTGNVAIGANAGRQNIHGTGNVFLGANAGAQEIGSNKLYISNTDTNLPLIYGDFDNEILRFDAKIGIGIISPAVALHIVDGTDATLESESGQLLLGHTQTDNLILDKNEIQARSNGAASILYLQQNGGDVYVGNAMVHASDARLKRDIENLSYGLSDVLKLRPTEYFWKGRTQDHKSLGLIAQEVNAVIKNVVLYDEKQDKYGVSYTELIPVLIKAIQEQQMIIKLQQKRNNRQSKDMADLESRLELIESKLVQLSNKF